MRVLQLAQTPLQFDPPVFALGNTLAKQGHEVICVGYWLPGLNRNEQLAPNYNLVRVPRGDYNWLPRILRGLVRYSRYWRAVAGIVSGFRPDLLIPTNYDVLPIATRTAPKGSKLLYYCTEYTPSPRVKNYLTGWGFAKRFEPHFVRQVHQVVSVESNRARLQAEDWGRPVDHVILNAPVLDESVTETALTAIAKREGPVRLVYAGTIGTRTCIDALLSAITELSFTVHLDLYGRVQNGFESILQAKLDILAKQPGKVVRYLGILPYELLPERLSEYDIGISFYDGNDINSHLASPAKLLEYLRAGLLILTTDQPTPKHIIGENQLGYVVKEVVADEIEPFLRELHDDPSKVSQMRQRALDLFQTDYTYERQSASLIDWINSLSTT